MKKISSLYDTFEIFAIFEISNFLNFKGQFWPNGHNHCQFFFVIFVKQNVLQIIVESESDRMSPRESAKNGQMGARGLNCQWSQQIVYFAVKGRCKWYLQMSYFAE